MKKPSTFILMAYLMASAISFYLVNRYVSILTDLQGELVIKLTTALDSVWPSIIASPLGLDFSRGAVQAGLVSVAVVWCVFLYQMAGGKHMYGIEHGSSEWGTPGDIAPLRNKDPDKNIILSATEQISIGNVANFEGDRNKNTIFVGGPGSGKTYGYVKPNLMQLNSSYVCTDPKGTLSAETGYLFVENSYRMRVFNTVEIKRSMHYNPLAYIRSERDILKVVTLLIENTTGEGERCSEKFWVDAEKLLYTALIAYLVYEADEADRNIPTMIDMLDKCGAREDDENYQSPIDILFESLEAEKPNCLAVRQYRKFRFAAGKTMKSILISCAARLAPFDISEIRELMDRDELALDTLGDIPTVLFIVMSDTDKTFSFLIGIMVYQLFNLLTEKADIVYHGSLPIHVQFILDEFANIGKIPDFEVKIASVRSRNISATIGLQSLSQLSAVYKDHADAIIDCCDSMVFLGGKSTKTTKQLSEIIGKTTIVNRNISDSRGTNGNFTRQDQSMGRDLIDPAEIGRLRRHECLVLITGLPPFRSKKYNPARHKRFKYLSDSKKRPLFDDTKVQEHLDAHFLDDVKEVEDIDLSELNSLI